VIACCNAAGHSLPLFLILKDVNKKEESGYGLSTRVKYVYEREIVKQESGYGLPTRVKYVHEREIVKQEFGDGSPPRGF
jgi:hypothetical protein